MTARLFVLSCLAAAPILAQQSATLSGTATDSSGAVVAGVSVRIIHTDTGESYTSVSNESGNYTITLIKPGSYELTAEAQGFKQYKQRGIVLETGIPSRIDLHLEVGGVTETITVEASTPQLRTETSSVGAVVRNETIVNMPLVGRRAAQLARLNGFMVQVGNGATFAMAGGRGDNANWTIDGGNAQNILLGVATLNFDPPIDSLEEFNVEISNYKAEQGRTGGGAVQMTTKSGTNRFHGSVYWFIRNDALDARNFFSANKPVLRYHQPGASLGGPIRKDKTFFFVNYEALRRKSQDTIIASIPSPAERSGDFSAGTANIVDPLNNYQPFPGRVIPLSRHDPVGRNVAALYPDPNVPGARSRNNNYRANRPVDNPANVIVTRIDHNFHQNHRLYGRYLTNSWQYNDQGPIFPTPGVDSSHQRSDNGYHNWAVTYLHNWGPATIGEFRWQWDWRKFHNYGGGLGLGLAERIGVKGTNPLYFPRFNITGIYPLGSTAQERKQVPIRGDNFSYSVSKVAGNHSLKAGVQYRRSRNDDVPANNGGGTFSFTPVAAGDAFAALLLGYPASASIDEAGLIRSLAATLGVFAQTDWRVTPRLTLNLGLRWDLDSPRHEGVNNQQNLFDQTAINPVCNCPGALAWSGRNGRSIYAHNFDYNNFGPRFGFAYRASDKWVLRGGASIVYTGQYDNATPLSVRIGFTSRGDFASVDGGRTAPFLLKDGMPPSPKGSEADLTPGFGAVPIGRNPTLSVEFFEPDRVVPYLETFNFNIQRQLGGNMIFEIGYLGTLGHKLVAPSNRSISQVRPELIRPGNVQSLRPFPQYSDVRVVQPAIGNSNYHGLNLKFDRRMSRGLQVQVNYTWAKAIDDVESRNELGGNAGDNAFANQYDRSADKGLSGNHVAHRAIGSLVWELPAGPGRSFPIRNPFLNLVAGGWTTGLILELRTGAPFGVIENNAAAVYPTAATVRSNAAGPYERNPRWRDNVLSEPFFVTSTYRQPAFGTFGNLGRTIATGPGAIVSDLSLLKDFNITESHRLQFRCEMLNFINRANFELPNQSRGVAAFGTINNLIGGNQARIIQLGMHYRF